MLYKMYDSILCKRENFWPGNGILLTGRICFCYNKYVGLTEKSTGHDFASGALRLSRKEPVGNGHIPKELKHPGWGNFFLWPVLPRGALPERLPWRRAHHRSGGTGAAPSR